MAYEYEWFDKPRTPMPGTQPTLKVGRWEVGYVWYDFTSMAPRGCRYAVTMRLPGMHHMQGHYSTEAKAKQRVEELAKYWVYYLYWGENAPAMNKPEAATRRVTRTRKEETAEEPVGRVRRSRPQTQEAPVGRVRRGPRAQ